MGQVDVSFSGFASFFKLWMSKGFKLWTCAACCYHVSWGLLKPGVWVSLHHGPLCQQLVSGISGAGVRDDEGRNCVRSF